MAIATTVYLQAGDVWMTEVRAGDQLLLAHGATGTLASPPQWVDGVALSTSTHLNPGAPHVLAHSGWVRVEMRSGGTLQWLAAPRPAWRAALARYARRHVAPLALPVPRLRS